MKNYHYNVKPRYTAGSPAAVDEKTALHQAEEEKKFHEMYLSGVMGEKNQALAEQLGLGPVADQERGGLRYSPAELVIEHSNHWFVRCLITGEMFVRPFQWVPVEKTTNCKRCRREHDLAELNLNEI
jgi:hypothetical protein